ncbi:hypothetical protein G6514_008487 [Epicoccum nigrum]|nr:hypothetical protein G6514_008487 [Epicoccum nigrum]
MAPKTGAADIPSSPSFDNHAASQQLLAEASSPAPRLAASTAVRGADLLNYARTLSKPAVLASSPQSESARKLTKPGKLSRASLTATGLLSETSSQKKKKKRGAHMYDLEPSPEKKRPHSLPAQLANSENEYVEDTLAVEGVEERVPETSQAQPEDEGLESLGIVVGLQMDAGSVPKKKRGKPYKSDEGTMSAAGSILEAPVSTAAEERAADGNIPSSPPLPIKRQRGRPRKSGESSMSGPALDTASSPNQVDEAAHFEPKPNRKTHPGKETDSTPNGDGSSKAPPKKLRRLNGPTMRSSDMRDIEEDLPSPKATRKASQKAIHSLADLGPPNKIPVRSSRSRTAQIEAAQAALENHSGTAIMNIEYDSAAKTHPQRALNRGSKKPTMLVKPSKRGKSGESHSLETVPGRVATAPYGVVKKAGEPIVDLESPIDDADEAVDDADAIVNQTRKKAGAENGKERSVEGNSRRDHKEVAKKADERDEGEELDGRAEQQGAEDHNEEAGADGAPLANATPTNNNSNISPLKVVFKFTDSEERDGECATKWGRIIRRRCASARVILCRSADDNPSLDDIAKLKDDLVGLLTSTNGKIREDRRVHFKRDAYAYLFRELTLVLEAMHDKLQETERDITASSSALAIVYHFLNTMLIFKDTIRSWKVKVPQRSQGDRLIRDVESNLVVPLRDIADGFRILLHQLKRADQDRQAKLEAQLQQTAREQELVRQEEELRSGRERRKRWQDLHIIRMQCEPDLARRRRLRFFEHVQTQEIDANGRPFERVPFLGERSAPPSTWIATVSDRKWTTEQETALLDDLQSSVPLERIFRRHCGPRGVLRDFSVPEFAAKMAWVRSGWAQLSQQHGWEIPEWVKKIPILP